MEKMFTAACFSKKISRANCTSPHRGLVSYIPAHPWEEPSKLTAVKSKEWHRKMFRGRSANTKKTEHLMITVM